ncbi:MAG: hypothetical protein NC393_14380 [Clostridium sp.]|nr:hypothetical protein [Clostridium sp.]MCM1208677.1 hypothetical protein [Ruminococcus sp.]
MRKIINTFRYGSLYTKKILCYALLDIIAFVVFGILAFSTKQMIYFFGLVVCVFILIFLIQTLSIHGMDEINPEDKPQKEKKGKKQKAAREPREKKEHKIREAKEPKPKKQKRFHFSIKEFFGLKDKKAKKSENTEKEKVHKGTSPKPKQQNGERAPKPKTADTEKTAQPKQNKAAEDEENKNLIVIRQVSDETADSYDKRKIKRTLYKYKVKKDHRLVLVDFSKKYMIKQCPAYIWVAEKQFNMLLLEEEPRHLAIPLGRIREITYLKKQSANVDTDYPMFHRNNLLTSVFKPYLPDYAHNTVASDKNSYKNLYGITGGIYFTNRSAKNLFDLLNVEFRVDDKVTTSSKVNIFFKDAYKANIMLRDNVIDANGYADSIANTLENMTKSTISYMEFKDTLNLMIKNKLITQEFASHYMGMWDKFNG